MQIEESQTTAIATEKINGGKYKRKANMPIYYSARFETKIDTIFSFISMDEFTKETWYISRTFCQFDSLL